MAQYPTIATVVQSSLRLLQTPSFGRRGKDWLFNYQRSPSARIGTAPNCGNARLLQLRSSLYASFFRQDIEQVVCDLSMRPFRFGIFLSVMMQRVRCAKDDGAELRPNEALQGSRIKVQMQLPCFLWDLLAKDPHRQPFKKPAPYANPHKGSNHAMIPLTTWILIIS